MQRGRLLIILGAVLGLATLGAVAFLVLGSGDGGFDLSSLGAPPPTIEIETQPQQIQTAQVIVALQPIGRGSTFVAGSIGRRDWPPENIPPGVIADEAETIGKVARTEIFQGQPIVREMLADVAGAGEASFQIDPGRVAVAYPINRQTSVSYALQPGDYVDILTTAFFVDVDEEFQSQLPNKVQFFLPELDSETGETIGFQVSEEFDQGRFDSFGDLPAIIFPRTGQQVPRRVAQLTVQSAKVIRVGPWIEPPPPPPPEEGEEAPTPTPNVPNIITLAVTPQDALVMLWLRQSNIYTELALRAAGEQEADHFTEAVTLQYMLTRFNVAVPPKIEFIMAPSLLEELDATFGVDEQTRQRLIEEEINRGE